MPIPDLTSVPFLSTLPEWGATIRSGERIGLHVISIHAPRVGSDTMQSVTYTPMRVISIHAPRVGSDAFPPPGIP